MKTILQISFLHVSIWQRTGICAIALLLFLNIPRTVQAQCPGGYTSATLNWDNMDYFHSNSNYSPWVSNPMKQTQNFAFGTNMLTISTTIPVGSAGTPTLYGDVTDHTGESGSYGNNTDVKFVVPNATAITMTLTFLNEVQNLQFSLYDIDQEITMAPTATNAGGTLQNITLTKPAGAASLIPLNGNAALTTVTGTAPLANWSTGGGSGTNYATNDNRGTINIDIAGPVKTVVITFSNDNNNRDFWLSDITACTANPGFPTNYYSSYTQPFTGQPSYFLANPQNLHVYMINAATGEADYIFSDPGTNGNKMNSLAYDPVNRWLYYVMDNAPGGPPSNRELKKYDFNTETISTVLADINTLGIPTFVQGIEFASATFYNGSLYLGVEGSDGSTYSTNGESVVWRIDFDGSGNAIRASQAFGTPGDDGSGNPTHDWGDFVIKDGTLITQASNALNNNHYIHYNMQTGASTSYGGNAETAGQLGQTWNGLIYRIKNNIALYNNDGTIGSLTPITTTSCSPAWSGNAGDASDPFKPKCDFGDAPASYDTDPLSPAVHQQHCNNANLRIGALWDREWSKFTSADASGDGTDEDGIGTVMLMVSDGNPYNHIQDVTVLNNTGANATLGGWLDYDADGVFEPSEGVIVTVPPSASPQTIYLTWSNITVAPGTPNSFLRIRLVSGTGTMTVNNPTGWYNDGEVEDYPVVSSNVPLSIRLLDFNAYVTTDKNVHLNWTAIAGDEARGFEIQRSTDQAYWELIGWKDAHESPTDIHYNFVDESPLTGRSYYRLKMVEQTGTSKYSPSKFIYLDQVKGDIKVFPNPVRQSATVSFTGISNTTATLRIRSLTGQLVNSRNIPVTEGFNRVSLDASSLHPGIYLVELVTTERLYVTKMTVTH